MKRYKVIDNKTKHMFNYTSFEWNLAWALVFILGIIIGIAIS